MENNEFKKVRAKNCTFYYFEALIDEKSHEYIFIYDII